MISIVVVTFICLVAIAGSCLYAVKHYDKHVEEEKEVLKNIVTLVNDRNAAVNRYLSEYIRWINDDFNDQCVELFMADTHLINMKEKYNIKDTEYVMAFQNVIADVQNINRVKTQELLTKVSNTMIEAVKNQLGEK